MAISALLESLVAVGIKVEAVSGTKEALTNAECVIPVFDPELIPPKEKHERKKLDGGWHPSARGTQIGQFKFKIELSGGSTTPAMAATVLTSLGLGAVTGPPAIYKADLKPPSLSGSTAKTVTIGHYVDGTLQGIYGAMGTAIVHFLPDDIIILECTYTGIWYGETDEALPVVTYVQPTFLRWAGAGAITFGAYAPLVSMMDIDLGNDVKMRPNPAVAGGFAGAYIAKRETLIKVDPERDLVANKDIWTEFIEGTESAFSAVCTNEDADTATFTATAVEWKEMTYQAKDGLQRRQIVGRVNSDNLQVAFAHSA